MEFTRNIGLKLQNLGFEFFYANNEENCDYIVYSKGNIEVTVDYITEQATVSISEPLEDTDLTWNELRILDKIYNKK